MMRLRQVCLVARQRDPAVADLCALLGLDVAYNDPGVGVFGLHNALMAIGDTFLEVVAPIQENTTAGRYLARRGGDGGYMLILQCDDLDAQRARIAKLGIRIAWSADLDDIRGTHLHPSDTGGALLSIDDATPPESWRWAGTEWQKHVRTDLVSEIVAAEMQSTDPQGLAERWARVLDRPLMRTGSGVLRIVLDQGSIRFVAARDGRGEGLGGFDVLARDPARILANARTRGLKSSGNMVIACGCRVNLV